MQFEMDSNGALLLSFVNKPTLEEINQFRYRTQFEIRLIKMYNVITLLFKIGNLNWTDAPYSPHLAKDFDGTTKFADGMGLALTILLIDTNDGKVISIRALGLGTKFSQILMDTAAEEKNNPFDIKEYRSNIQSIYSRYSSKDLAKLSNIYYKIHNND